MHRMEKPYGIEEALVSRRGRCNRVLACADFLL